METDWTRVKNFERKEWRTNPEKINSELIYLVDELASYVKTTFNPSPICIIHVAYEDTGHSANSQHYLGFAVDLHFHGIPLLDQYLSAERFPFTGIGIYPYWNNPGLHLDIRSVMSPYARWQRDRNGEYGKLDAEFIREVARSMA